MAVHVDYLQALIERGDVYDPDVLPPSPGGNVSRLPVRFPASSPIRRRRLGLTAVQLLAGSALISWSIVAVETWMLVR